MAAMQFWGVEVKGKEPCKVKLEEGHIIHLSQAVLGEVKKEADPVIIHVKVDDKKLVLGVLNAQNNPQLSFDLVFDKEFEISHNWKNGSVHLLGYQSEMPDDSGATEEFSDFSDDEEDLQIPQKENGKPAAVAPAAIKPAAKPNKDNKPMPEKKDEKEDGSDDDEDESDDEDDSDDEDMLDMGDDSGEDEDDSEDEEESSEDEKPAKVAEAGKKRPQPDAKTPEAAKKAKLATPQKTDGKKSGHTATPHPSKKGGKSPGGDKSTPNSNKSAGQVSCGSCKKTFNSEVGLQSHSKAKHGGK